MVARLGEAPGVVGVGTYRGVRVPSPLGPTHVVALGIGPGSYRQFRFLSGSPDAVWPAFQDGGAAIVSEPTPTGTASASAVSCGCGPIGASARSPWPACSPTTAPTRAWS